MAPTTLKPLIWFLEETTPEVAHLMHELEASLIGTATVQRVSYTEALRQLPRKDVRQGLAAVVVFSLDTAKNLAALLKGNSGPRLCFFPPTFEAMAAARPSLRWGASVTVVARHLGEAKLLVASGFKPENVVRLQADVFSTALPDQTSEERPLRVGFAWYNLAPGHRKTLAKEIARWQQSAGGRSTWTMLCMPGDEPPDWEGVDVEKVVVTPEALDERGELRFDVLLVDPWWPDALPRPCRAAVHIFLPPGGAEGEYWNERLQGLINLVEAQAWDARMLANFRYQPLWRHLLKGEERACPELPTADLAALADLRDRLAGCLEATRAAWDSAPTALEEAHYFWLYDYQVQVSWCHDLWQALAGAKNGKRHALLLAFNALPLHHTGKSWLFKRLLARTPLGEVTRARRFTRGFYSRFAWRHRQQIMRWVRTLLSCGRDPASDPLSVSREVASALLAEANVTIVRRNEPAPEPGVPIIYLVSHRNADLDPFLLLHVLRGPLAVVVGPRAQRWPLVKRLGHSSAFVLTGRERGVVIADAIASLRSRRALALYPEVAEPTYMGESNPLRGGLLWIVQALESAQVIPVVFDDAFTLGAEGGTVSLWFGAPIPCTPKTGEELLHRVRRIFHDHLLGLDGVTQMERRVPAESAEAPLAN